MRTLRRAFPAQNRLMKLRQPMSSAPELRVLYEDHCIVAVDKPHNMLSVPGRQIQANDDGSVTRRSVQWQRSIVSAQQHAPEGSEVATVLNQLSQVKNPGGVPRNERRFLSYLQRVLRVSDPVTRSAIWSSLTRTDVALHRRHVKDIPLELVSADDIVRETTEGLLFHVHRLDMETAGVLLFAKNGAACANLSAQFRDRVVSKTYLGEVSGLLDPNITLITAKLAPSDVRPLQRISEAGKEAVTEVQVVEHRQGPNSDCIEGSTLVKLAPITGRTHQLRLHMMHVGHGVLGDTLYHTPASAAASTHLRLHAQCLRFRHPTSNKEMAIESTSCKFV